MARQPETKRNFTTILKNVFFVLIILQFAPVVVMQLKDTVTQAVNPTAKIGLIHVDGLIRDSDHYIKHIRSFYDKDDIKALLIKIDCYGGFPGACQAIFHELNRFDKKKPVVAYIENVAASGGYYIAAAARSIITTSSAMVGNIGALMGPLPQLKDRLDEWKIGFNFIQAGRYKSAGNPLRHSTPEELALLQGVVDDTYDQFINDVATARDIDVSNHQAWADGRIFTGRQAMDVGLTDTLGSMQDALDITRKFAGIEEKALNIIKPVRATGLRALFSASDEYEVDTVNLASSIGRFLRTVLTSMTQAETISEARPSLT